MFDKILDAIKRVSDVIKEVEEKVGFWRIIKWLLLIGFIIFIIKFKTVTNTVIELWYNTADNFHLEKMKLRDKYMTDLNPLLIELRTELDADRVLYFEYHNSEENLDKTPFKFFDLMAHNVKHSIIGTVPYTQYKDVNASQYQTMYNDIRDGSILYCEGPEDNNFRQKYQGMYELLNENDKSKKQVLFSIPGVNTPIGFIALEWMNDSVNIDRQKVKEMVHHILPKINALVVASKR